MYELCPKMANCQDQRESNGLGPLYSNLRLKNLLSIEKNFVWCPSLECESGQIHDRNSSQPDQFHCVACSQISCLKHPCQWHEGLTCAQYDKEVKIKKAHEKEEKESEEYPREQRDAKIHQR
ncbi:hypothetical protein HYFRA_00013056 [Hymenoscyphus fraxineus]|uniref:IBR domain-containing protein n=1 Tax=Hymenoscyphus fraxineus TaxID=746836 RepID=A0A9N9PTM1_9HELO|nr:hypothetical protein HYFRA_00013056 [Hymenoscyphus fraxineus]